MQSPQFVFRSGVITVLMILITACSHISMGTLWALRSTNVATMDPGVMRIALALPEQARLESVSMELKFTNGDKVLIDSKIEFEIMTSGPEIQKVGFPDNLRNRHILKIPDSALAEISYYQMLFREERERSTGAQASLGISTSMGNEWLNAYCSENGDTLRVSAWVLFGEDQGYVPIVKNSEIERLLDQQTANVCPTTGR